ncbi:4-hydroxythreonine-4-phosphate dehydrogenase PdxA [Woodsholea maritima]|uniref:4-hydroxythreonine-4-phosphate dehydrogenase PdxA n=1 Tax=Woodsholea maritima TaxID=240237 RepID=UPI000361C2A8|nr:4-hydroxythreonine-4-phosphate dehydrogenase PdxA [Woodsholea maritima]
MPKALALSLGDPDGIGPEIAVKAWNALREDPHAPRFIAIGARNAVEAACALLKVPAPQILEHWDDIEAVFPERLPLLALPRAEGPKGSAEVTIAAIERAVGLTLDGQASGVVTCPISKARLYEQGFRHPGHTEFIAQLCQKTPYTGTPGPIMMLAAPELKVTLVTIHLSLKDAIAALSPDLITRTIRITHEALKRDFGLANPRIAVAGLNPHAGEGGALGHEDEAIIRPAIEALRAEGLEVFGPLPPDTMFHTEARERYDAAVCMYHDQGLIPLKTLNFHGGVNTTLGLPIVRTSPDHGTAFDIAAQGLARADSLIAALHLAQTMADNRLR